MFNVEQIREQFPILKRKIHGHPLIYVDNAASSQKPRAVLDAMQKFYEASYANIHRGVYTIAEEATEQYEGAREAVAKFLNAPHSREIVFTRGTTEAINLVKNGYGRKFIKTGDEILLTEMEHHSNLVPWQMLAQEKGAKLKFIPVDCYGKLMLEQLDLLLTDKTKLVALTMASNMLGTINPVEAIIQKAHARNIPVLLDAAQAVPHLKIDVQKLDCDFLAFSSHKMLGPTGIGALYAKTRHLEAMDPFLGGGEMIKTVEWERSTWNDIPWKFEAGTQSIAEAVGLKAAIEFLEATGREAIHQHEQSLVRLCMERLQTIEEIRYYGPPLQINSREAARGGGSNGFAVGGGDASPLDRVGLISFNVKGVHPHDVAAVLDRNGICVRAGHHCTQPLHHKLGIDASARASFYLYNTKEEIDCLMDGLKECVKLFRK